MITRVDNIKLMLVTAVNESNPTMMQTAIKALADWIDDNYPNATREEKELHITPIMADVINQVKEGSK